MERGGISNKKIRDVMMFGYPPVCFKSPLYDYLQSVKHAKGGAVTVKVKDDIVVVYNKRSKIAITTYNIPDKFKPSDEYLLPQYKKIGDKNE